MTSVADRRLKHEWVYRDVDTSESMEGRYRCSRCGQTGDLATETLHAFGGAIRPDIATVDPVICSAEDVHTPPDPETIDKILNDIPTDNEFGNPAIETTASPEEVHHRLLVGSDSRVAIHFTQPVEFYTMTPREAFDLANDLLQAAYTSRERQEGILHPLGPKVLNGENENQEAKK